MVRSCWFLILYILPALALGQVKRALNLMDKVKYDQAEELLYRSIRKDSLNPGEKYVLSVLYFTEDYYNYNIDSAHYYAVSSINDYKNSDVKTIEKLLKEEITGEDLVRQKEKVEEFLFKLAKIQNTEEGYNNYINMYPTSPQYDSAIWYRNKVAFREAEQINNWQSYEAFMLKYPDAEQYETAKDRYEKLIYEDKTRDDKLASYKEFLNDHPETPYRKEVEKSIFNISTGAHKIEDYASYILDHETNYWKQLAASRLYHLNRSSDEESSYIYLVYKYLDKDSLEILEKLEANILFPVMENGAYKFLDKDGGIPFENAVKEIPERYRCGNIQDPLLLIHGSSESFIINRLGKVIYSSSEIADIRDLGHGFFSFDKEGKQGLLFKTGELILSPTVDEIKIVNGQYIAYRINDLWGLHSVNNIQMAGPQFSAIEMFSSFIKIENRKGRFALIKPRQLLPLLDKGELKLDFRFDDAEFISEDQILVYSEDTQGLLKSDLSEEIPIADQEIFLVNKGLIIETSEGYGLISPTIDVSPALIWEQVDFNSGWISLKGPNGWFLVSIPEEKIIGEYMDSVNLLNRSTALSFKNGIRSLYFSNGAKISLGSASRVETISSPPIKNLRQVHYTIIKEDEIKWLLSETGDTLLTEDFSEVRALGNEYLVVVERNGSGLLDSVGNRLLKSEYDGIANYNNGGVTLLKDGKLGYYRRADSTYIPPVYFKSIRTYSDSLFIAYEEDGYGLINRLDEKISELVFDEIKYFNDSVAWVKKDDLWHLYDFYNSNLIQEEISDYFSSEDINENYLYFVTKSGKGVINRKNGTIITATFNEVINVGSKEDPVFLAEKYVDEADYFVLIYYDHFGEILYRQAYTAKEYENLICEK